MSTTVAETLRGKELVTRICKYFVRRIVFPLAVLCSLRLFFPENRNLLRHLWRL